MNQKNYTALNALVDIIAAPAKALDEAKLHARWLWWPLLITIGSSCALFIFYYSWVDMDWLVQWNVDQVPTESRAEAEDGIRSFMQPTTMMITTSLAVIVMSFVIYTIEAIYLNLANKLVTGADIRFGQWFALAAWTGFVSVLGVIAGFMVMLLADSNQIQADALQVLTLNSLLLNNQPGDDWYTWGNTVSILHPWLIALMVLGYQRWTGDTLMRSAIIVCLPWVLIFGIWALII